MSITENSLILDGQISLDNYQLYWLDNLKQDLPNTIIFWGTAAATSLFLALAFRNDRFGFSVFIVFAFIILAIPILITLYSYFSFMSASRKYIVSLSEIEKNFQLVFKTDGSGFDCIHGENFSHFSWKSINRVVEKENYFVLMFRTQPWILLKEDFANDEETMFFRKLVSENTAVKPKFLKN